MRTFRLIALTSSNEHDPIHGNAATEILALRDVLGVFKTHTSRPKSLAIRELLAQK